MDKAIYGLAMPFNNSYWEYDDSKNTYTFERTNKKAVVFDTLVGATIDHDYSKTLGDIRDNLIVKANEHGVVFKLTPNCPLGFSVYKKVKRNALRHCSVSYLMRKAVRDFQEEYKLESELQHMLEPNEKIVVKDHSKILLFELCLTNDPANKDTFCTTDKDHPLLKGVIWE